MIKPLPSPCTTRPATSCAIVVAVPARTRPTRKHTMPTISGVRGPRLSVSWPAATMPTTLATRKPVNAHPKPPRPPTARAAVGSAAETAIASKASSVMRISRPTLVARSGAVKIVRDCASTRGCSSTVTRPLCKLNSTSIQLPHPDGAVRAIPAHSPGKRGQLGTAEKLEGWWGSALALGDLVGQLRRDLEQVTHDTEVGELEDRRLRVL